MEINESSVVLNVAAVAAALVIGLGAYSPGKLGKVLPAVMAAHPYQSSTKSPRPSELLSADSVEVSSTGLVRLL